MFGGVLSGCSFPCWFIKTQERNLLNFRRCKRNHSSDSVELSYSKWNCCSLVSASNYSRMRLCCHPVSVRSTATRIYCKHHLLFEQLIWRFFTPMPGFISWHHQSSKTERHGCLKWDDSELGPNTRLESDCGHMWRLSINVFPLLIYFRVTGCWSLSQLSQGKRNHRGQIVSNHILRKK